MGKDGLNLLISYMKMDPYRQHFPPLMLDVNKLPQLSGNCCPTASGVS